MCGIFGYVGEKSAPQTILNGLKRLEYRGYDSWGISVINGKEIIETEKDTGYIPSEVKKLSTTSNIGIGHTRWATHGGVTVQNAHPHFSNKYSFTIAQNGIVENYEYLKQKLTKKGYIFKTQVDTEVILRLIEQQLDKKKDLREALINTFKQLEGRNTVILLDQKEKQIYAIRNGSPLILGISEKEIFLASDPLAFSNLTSKIVEIQNNELIHIQNGKYSIFSITDDKKVNRREKDIHLEDTELDKGEYKHYMLKEIVEQSKTVISATKYTEDEIRPLLDLLRSSKNIYIIGAGTAGFAADQIAYYLRKISKLNTISFKSYESDSYIDLIGKDDLIIAVSQSGETADTIETIEYAKEKGAKIASIVNMPGSTISRLSNTTVMSNAGPEVCVASTKVFTSQISFGYLLAKSYVKEYENAQKEVKLLSRNLKTYFNDDLFKNIQKISKKLLPSEHFFILGKGQNFSIAQEGALKIKEISYKHFEGFAAGELKHGVIALIEKGTPVISIISEDGNEKDMISATQEVKARGAYTVGVGDSKFKDIQCFDSFIPVATSKELRSIANVVPFQLISYFLALALGNSIDKPRNLAKSVTVK